MKAVTPKLAILALSGVLVSVAGASDFLLPWTAGWDLFDRPLNYSRSFVAFHQPANTRNVQVFVHLDSALPGIPHLVGMNLYWGPEGTPGTGMCQAHFGQFSASNCAYACRQNICRTYNSFELGVLITGEHGNGNLSLTATNVKPGNYEAQFYVRGYGPPASPVIYQAPAPYGLGTIKFTVPAR